MSALPGRLVLLGHPLGHSLSPVFQNAALRAAGIPLTYEKLDTPRSALEDTLQLLRRERAAGNVTIPYKENVARACDRLSSVARAIGAVNTFWTAVDGALVGDNTDAPGFDAAARELIGDVTQGQVVAILGAGGAAAAVLHAVKGWPGSRVRMYSRTRERAAALVARSRADAEVSPSATAAVRGATLVVNATPVGMSGTGTPVPVEDLDDGSAVLDVVVRPEGTDFVRQARARGLRATDGTTMLLAQGALAFERWFGMAPDRDVMWAALRGHR